MNSYRKFIKLPIDFSTIGLIPGGERYFCTPKGARILARTGMDGIHFCLIRGFGDIIFAVSPANGGTDCVHPVAANFTDFLRLTISCGVDAIEQAWMWDKTQFEDFLSQNCPTQEQIAILDTIANTLHLTPMEQPYFYLNEIQTDFPYARIPFDREYYDTIGEPIPNSPTAEWKVFYPDNPKSRAGTELILNKQEDWDGTHLVIPAAYVCSKGMVLDLCISAPADRLRQYINKWLDILEAQDGVLTTQQENDRDNENPLNPNFSAVLTVNGKNCRLSQGTGLTWIPDDCLEDGISDSEAERFLQHYRLDETCGWMFWRMSFPWATKGKPSIRSLQLTLTPNPVKLFGEQFITPVQQKAVFSHPVTGVLHMLNVEKIRQQYLPEHIFLSEKAEYPRYYTTLCYTLSPDLPKNEFTLQDADPNDPPLPKPNAASPKERLLPEAQNAAAIAIIGGADGPTALFCKPLQDTTARTATSSLHFNPTDAVEWRMIFWHKDKTDLTIPLL